jgi:hypothetical protein
MRTLRTLLFVPFFLVSTFQIVAQGETDTIIVQKGFEILEHTFMERFEPAYVVSAQERAEMKRKRIANTEFTLSILDTIQISNRKRKLLLHDLKYNPFSDRLSKFIVEIKFDGDDLANQQ